MTERITLFEAVRNFLGPIMAEAAMAVTDGPDDAPVTVEFGPYRIEMTLADLKKLDRAYAQAFEEKERMAERRAKGSLL